MIRVPLSKIAGDLIQLGGPVTWTADAYVGGTKVASSEFGSRTEAWTWAKKQAGPGRKVLLFAFTMPPQAQLKLDALEVAEAGKWPESGFLELPAGTQTEFQWVSENGKPFGAARIKSWDCVDRFVLGDDGQPSYFDTDMIEVAS